MNLRLASLSPAVSPVLACLACLPRLLARVSQSLSELIRKTKRFTEDEARRYMLQILEATSYLHRHQIIHRDLKLGNVFLDKDWNVKARRARGWGVEGT